MQPRRYGEGRDAERSLVVCLFRQALDLFMQLHILVAGLPFGRQISWRMK
ncbi:hypothetical protein ABRZ24_10845 [Brenneria populi]|uniref:Uncharacterized protein n=1 Tax=Brenneria populi TaxID=1505588 RepID=A0ABU6JR55_9GAMM|nr:hypothetical protein [Brenneria populi Li et al. 2015]